MLKLLFTISWCTYIWAYKAFFHGRFLSRRSSFLLCFWLFFGLLVSFIFWWGFFKLLWIVLLLYLHLHWLFLYFFSPFCSFDDHLYVLWFITEYVCYFILILLSLRRISSKIIINDWVESCISCCRNHFFPTNNANIFL